jgi:hypothetical protein
MATGLTTLEGQYHDIRAALVDLDASTRQSEANKQQFMINLLTIIEDIYDDMIGRLNQCETGRDVGEALGPLEEIDPELFRQLMGYLDEQIERNNNSYDFDPTELIRNITPILNKERRNLRTTRVNRQPPQPRIMEPLDFDYSAPVPDSSIFGRVSSFLSGSDTSRRRPPAPRFRSRSEGPRRGEPLPGRRIRPPGPSRVGLRYSRGRDGYPGLRSSGSDISRESSGSDISSSASVGGWRIKTKSQLKSKSQVKTKDKRVKSKGQSKKISKNKPKLSFM